MGSPLKAAPGFQLAVCRCGHGGARNWPGPVGSAHTAGRLILQTACPVGIAARIWAFRTQVNGKEGSLRGSMFRRATRRRGALRTVLQFPRSADAVCFSAYGHDRLGSSLDRAVAGTSRSSEEFARCCNDRKERGEITDASRAGSRGRGVYRIGPGPIPFGEALQPG